jgi:hypothetical protein
MVFSVEKFAALFAIPKLPSQKSLVTMPATLCPAKLKGPVKL